MIVQPDMLVQAMQAELEMQSQLAAVLSAKLEAMRRRDLPAMEQALEQEQRLLGQVRQAVHQRTLTVRRLAQRLMPGKPATQVRAREMAQVLPEPIRSQMLGLIGQLREQAEATGRLNGVITQATRRLMGHVDAIFNVITQSGQSETAVYGRGGKRAQTTPRQLVDAMA